jgi:hypothetical protein
MSGLSTLAHFEAELQSVLTAPQIDWPVPDITPCVVSADGAIAVLTKSAGTVRIFAASEQAILVADLDPRDAATLGTQLMQWGER